MSEDLALRKLLRRALCAAGYEVAFAAGPDLGPTPPSLLVIDDPSRAALSAAQVVALAEAAPTILIGPSLADDATVALLRNTPIDHIVPALGQLDERDLVPTARILAGDDPFGLHKRLLWGGELHELEIGSYQAKRDGLAEVCELAERLSVRRPQLAKVESITDELLMNAMYDAPAESGEFDGPIVVLEGESLAPAKLRYGGDGCFFAVAVEDRFGLLRKETLLDYLLRARAERGAPKRAGATAGGSHTGAGLGTYFIVSGVSQLIIAVEPGRRTELCCLFDLRTSPRSAPPVAQAFHFFRRSVSV
jgi:hypothetical protein